MAGGEFDDVDVVLMVQVEESEAERPFEGVDAVAARAIIALSRAGADLMRDSVMARNRDGARLSKRGYALLDQARQLMTELVQQRRAR